MVASIGRGPELCWDPSHTMTALPAPDLVPLRLLLVRHGLSSFNTERRIQGRDDLSCLTDEGHSQARLTGAALADLHLDAVYSSPLSRAAATAAQLLEAQGGGLSAEFEPPVVRVPGWIESTMLLVACAAGAFAIARSRSSNRMPRHRHHSNTMPPPTSDRTSVRKTGL